MQRYFLLFLFALFAVLPGTAQTNKQIRSLQKQQSALKKNIADQEKMLRSTKKDVNSQLANLQVISAQVEEQQRYVSGIHSELTALSNDLSTLEKQLAALEKDLNDCKRKYQRAVSYMFRNRMKFSQWQFILSAKNFRQMYRRMRYVTEFSRYQRAQGRIIQQKEARVKAKRDEIQAKRAEKNRLFEEGRAETAKLESRKQERQTVVDELNKKQKELKSSIAQQRRKASQLDARIDKLIQQEIIAAEKRRKAEAEKRRKAELARQAKEKAEKERAAKAEKAKRGKATAKKSSSSSKKSKSTAKKSSSKASTLPDDPASKRPSSFADPDRALSSSFAAQRGRLPMPITGSYSITTHYGQYNVAGLNGVQLDSKGINITGVAGAQARAVYQGEVTAVFTMGGLYNIIVRHGSYMSVYCNLSSASVRQGQQVQARQTLGTIARDASGNSTLHFQLRKETAKLNPETWLGR